MSDKRDKGEKVRLSVTFARATLDTFDYLVDEGRYLDHQDAIRDAVRIFFRLWGLKPWRFSAELPEKGGEEAGDRERATDLDI